MEECFLHGFLQLKLVELWKLFRVLSKDFHRDNVITMEVSLKQLDDGKVIFCKIFAIEIC